MAVGEKTMPFKELRSKEGNEHSLERFFRLYDKELLEECSENKVTKLKALLLSQCIEIAFKEHEYKDLNVINLGSFMGVYMKNSLIDGCWLFLCPHQSQKSDQ